MNGRSERREASRAGTSLRGRLERTGARIAAAARAAAPTLPRGAVLGCVAFMLCRATLLGARPFGFAWLAAAPHGVPFIAAGILISALTLGGSEGVMLAAVCLFTVALRLAVRALVDPPHGGRALDAAFGENIYLRMATASVAAFSAGLWRLIAGGFYFYDLRGAIVSMIVAPIAAGIFEPVFRRENYYNEKSAAEGAEKRRRPHHGRGIRALAYELERTALRYDAALAAVFFCVVFALRGDTFAGLAPGHAAAAFLIFAAARRRDALRAAACGALLGAAFGWLWIPAYALAALAAWAIFRVSEMGGASAGALVLSLAGFFIGGFSGLLTILPASLTGAATFCAAAAAITAHTKDATVASEPSAVGGEAALFDARERIGELSDAFGELSAAFSELAECRRAPGETEVRRIADEVSDEVCAACPEKKRCWELEYDSTLAAFCALAGDAFGGRARRTAAKLPARCGRPSDITERMRTLAAAGLRRTLEDERLSLFACDYRAISGILADAAEANRREHTPDEEAGERVRSRLAELGVRARSVTVSGARRVKIEVAGADLTRCRTRVSDLRRALEATVGVPLTDPAFELDGGEATLCLRSRRRISAAFSAARGAPDGGVCGDTVMRLENRNDYFYAFICDGMGRGSEAAFTAGVCGVFLKRMLSAQNSVETSLRLLNSIIRGKGGDECSAGVDLLEIDLLTGKAALYKGGAAPSYLRRGDKIYSLSSQSVPLGIIGELDAGKTEFAVEPGDMILMISDGVLAGTDEDADGSYVWLLDLLSACDARHLDETARRALRMARIAGSRDDASAAVIAIGEEPPRPGEGA